MTRKPDFDTWAHAPHFMRQMVPLASGKKQPRSLEPAPEGYRWETDDELRERVLHVPGPGYRKALP
jgi:hypothetical protein